MGVLALLQTHAHINTMLFIKLCNVIVLVGILTLTIEVSVAVPKHKPSKLKFSDNDIPDATSDTCKTSEPCGWALYVPGSSPRKIYKYTRNIFCSCSGGSVCSLTRDALQQNSFVFYCRPKETSKFRFPDSRKNGCYGKFPQGYVFMLK